MNKVFVTGADGMLGSSICRELIKQGYTVKALCLNQKTIASIKDLGIELVYGDILNKETLTMEMKGCHFVIHIAALTSVWPRRSEKMGKVNIRGTKNVMESARLHKMKRMIHIGSASSFGHGSRQLPGDENRSFEGWKYGMDYIESKYLAQEMLMEQFKRTGFPVLIINPTFMIGPFDSAPSSGKMLLGLYNNTIPGYSGGGKNFVCSQDVAVAAVNALTKGRTGQCYIAGNQNLSFKDFFTTAASVMQKKFTLKPIPYVLILFAGAFSSAQSRIFGRPPKMSYGMARMANVEQYFTGEKAVKELNMPQTPIHTGIKQCMDWFNYNGYLK